MGRLPSTFTGRIFSIITSCPANLIPLCMSTISVISYAAADFFLFSSIITHRVPLEDMPKLYDAFDKRLAGVEKVFVETRFSSEPSEGCPTLTRVGNWNAIN